jgi:hypothetical protein
MDVNNFYSLSITIPQRAIKEAYIRAVLDNSYISKDTYIDCDILLKDLLESYGNGTYRIIKNNVYKYEKNDYKYTKKINAVIPNDVIKKTIERAKIEKVYVNGNRVDIKRLARVLFILYAQNAFIMGGK